MQTVEFLTESCYDFHHRELTVNRLTGALFRPHLSDTGVIFRLTRVQTFTAVSLNNPVYG